jgi:serine protease
MSRVLRHALVLLLLLGSGLASATFHTFVIDQVYSDASRSIQFVVLREAAGAGGQHLLAGHRLTASEGGATRTFTFPSNLPSSNTASRSVLIATEGFAALGLVTPDYVVPDGFVPVPAGFVDFAGVDRLTYAALPTDGVNAIDGNGQVRANRATNFAGASASVAAASPNFTALWWNPLESGWGLNVDHQGNILFATLFTYDAAGLPLWLVMSNGVQQSNGTTFTGELYRTTGPAFNAVPFPPIGPGNITLVGTMTLAFSGANAATLSYTFNGAAVTKAIERQVFGSRAAACANASGSRAGLANYQDLWWNAAESGWGVNVTHQDNILFATLFTYDATGRGLWLVMPDARPQADGSYLGTLYRTTGPAFNAVPFTPIGPGNITPVGMMQFRFANGESATLVYTVDGVTVTKQIVRQVFSSPVPACS